MAVSIDFEEGTSGASLDTHPDLTVIPPGSSEAFYTNVNPKNGALCGRFTSSGASNVYVTMALAASTNRYVSFYFRPATPPGANVPIFYTGSANGGAGIRTCQVVYNSAGTMKVQDTNAVIVGSATGAVSTGAYNRCDVSIENGQVTFALYPGASADDPVGTALAGNTVSGALGNASTVYMYFGIGLGTALDVQFDDVRVSESALPGPVGGGTTPDPGEPVQWRVMVNGQWEPPPPA